MTEALFAAGIGLATWGAISLAAKDPLERLLGGAPLRPRRSFAEKLAPEDRAALAGCCAGLVLMLLLAWGSRFAVFAAVSGGALGAFVVQVAFRLQREAALNARRREVVVMFEAVDTYLRAGMSMPYALACAKALAPHLSKAVSACLAAWPSGPAQALEILRKKIDLPEADLMVSLLLQIEKAGVMNLEGVVRKEALNLERMREAAARAKIATRPLYFVVYRLLPLLVVFGMFAGTLYWRLLHMLKHTMTGF